MTEPAETNSAAKSTGAFDSIFPGKEWAVFSGFAVSTAAIAAYAYEWGYGDAIGFDVISTTTVADRASEWRVLWPIVISIFAGRLLIPFWGDMSGYPEWAQKLRKSGISGFGWVGFGIVSFLAIAMMFVPGFRETHPEIGDDPSRVSAYSIVVVLLMFVSSPIFEVNVPLGKVGLYLSMVACAVLFAHFLGGQDGEDILNARVQVPLACLKEDGTQSRTPVAIIRSFSSGSLVVNPASRFYWLEAKDTKKLEFIPPSAVRDPSACSR
ncbi:hypothetical protein [Bradyrhizobium sp. BR 10289]|uniref:hypothetical protein n=1 Tax=Bradyrhizobium sp. BR 10289 TaxID=2749993 RepID=UPI001C654064|nr:hypothetical protein [Bradyrhizobium sp. BR 10289]MBW7970039.1 hypothetical protein [Bradyrhizobium sp. BR 10289]